MFPENPFPQYLDPDNPDWILTQQLIKSIHDLSVAHHAKFLLVLLPQRNYLNGKYDPIIYDKMQAFAMRENISHINLIPAMTSYHWSDLFYPEDGHFTPMGAQVAAQAISRVIQIMDKQ